MNKTREQLQQAENDRLRTQVMALETELAKVREIAHENLAYFERQISVLIKALKPFADYDDGDLPDNGSKEAAALTIIQAFQEKAKAAIAAVESEEA